PFVFDDIIQIEDKAKIRDLSRFLSIDQLFAPRPLVEFTFALNYQVGKLNVFGYHLVNVLIHMANAFVVYFLALNIFLRLLVSRSKASVFPNAHISLMALVTALIFVAHPVQTQAVTYTAQRYTSMAALFYFLSILTYIRGRSKVQCPDGIRQEIAKGKKEKGRVNSSRRLSRAASKPGDKQATRREERPLITTRFGCIGWFSLSFVFGGLAFLSKQNAASLPFAILLAEYFLFDRTWNGWKRKLIWFIPAFLLMAILILYVSGLFRGDFDFASLLEDVSALSRETVEVTRWSYLCTQFNVIVVYIRLLFLPFGQNLDYMYPFKAGLFDGLTPVAFLFLGGIVALGIWCAKTRPIIAFGIFWFFIALSVESSIIPISDALFEHRLYLPMFGFAMVVSYVLASLLQDKRLWLATISVAIITYFGTATYLRNRVWKDPIVLWRDVLAKSPENYRGHNNLGFALYHQGKVEEAIETYRKGLRINPGSALTKNNLATALLHQGRTEEAITYLSDVVRRRPRYVGAHNNLGVALASQGRFEEAVRSFSRALRLDPYSAEAHNGLANAFASQGRFEEAVVHWKKAIELRPDYAAARYNLGIALQKGGKLAEAEMHFQAAIEAKSGYAEAHSKLAVLLAKKGDWDGALDHFAEALKTKPGLLEARNGLKNALILKNQSLKRER
ncbi:MAG: tetratricopeptide repeat protein, partial [Syntrophorhabdus sp.]